MSNIPVPTQATIKSGFYQTKDVKGGLNLPKWLMAFLKKIGFANTVDYCTYYPTAPSLLVVNRDNPLQDEMVNIPIQSFFIAVNSSGEWSFRIKTNEANSTQLAHYP